MYYVYSLCIHVILCMKLENSNISECPTEEKSIHFHYIVWLPRLLSNVTAHVSWLVVD